MTVTRWQRAGLVVFLLIAPRPALAQRVIGVLGIAREVAAVEQRLADATEQTIRGHVFRVGTIAGRPVVVGRAGVGKVNAAIAATLLIDHFNPSVLLFSGTAGALDTTLAPGDIVIGANVAQHDVGRQTAAGLVRRGPYDAVSGTILPLMFPAGDQLMILARRVMAQTTLPELRTSAGVRAPRIVEGIIVTGDVFLTDAARAAELRQTLGASAVEMEGAAVVQTCRQFAVACLVVRSITDGADGLAPESYKQFLTAASDNAAAIVAAIIALL